MRELSAFPLNFSTLPNVSAEYFVSVAPFYSWITSIVNINLAVFAYLATEIFRVTGNEIFQIKKKERTHLCRTHFQLNDYVLLSHPEIKHLFLHSEKPQLAPVHGLFTPR